MWSLFKSELLRFRAWVLAFGLLHLVVLVFFNQLFDLLQQPRPIYVIGALLYGLVGLLFGLYQMGSYRKPNQWLYLLHRPVSPGRIFLALVGATSLMFAVAVLLPLLVSLVGIDLFSARVVDVRHYLLPPFVLLVTVSFYLVGCYALLSPGRAAWFALVLPALALATPVPGAWKFLAALGGLLWLAALARQAFKPDRSTHPEGPVLSVATALPLQVGLYVALFWAGSLAYQFGLMFIGRHPLNGTPPAGGYTEASRAEAADLLSAGLGNRQDAESHLWREQVRIAELFQVHRAIDEYPVRHQLANLVPLEWDDAKSRTRWTFSHDQMLFHGVGLDTFTSRGWLGTQGLIAGGPETASAADRFSEPPFAFGDKYLLTQQRLYQFEPHEQQVHLRVELPEGERFAAPPQQVGRQVVLLSDRQLYFFDARDFGQEHGVMAARLRLEVPGEIRNLDRIDLAELLEGYLVSFTFGKRSHRGEGEAYQVLLRLDPEGKAQVLNRRELRADFPALFLHKSLVASPVLHSLEAVVSGEPILPASGVPSEVWATVTLLAILSMGVSTWWLLPSPMSRQRKAVWILAAGVMGLPGLLSLLLLYPRPERAELLHAVPA